MVTDLGAVLARVEADGELAPGWDVDDVAACWWAVTSQRTWDDLVVALGWSTEQYRTHVTALVEAALLRGR